MTAGRAASTARAYARMVGKTCLSVPPRRFSGGGTFSWTSGARLMPQLPTTTVVTPWLTFGSICGDESTIWSSCVCTSMKPGADDASGDVDHGLAASGEIRADLADPTVLHPHVGNVARTAVPSIIDAAAQQDRAGQAGSTKAIVKRGTTAGSRSSRVVLAGAGRSAEVKNESSASLNSRDDSIFDRCAASISTSCEPAMC